MKNIIKTPLFCLGLLLCLSGCEPKNYGPFVIESPGKTSKVTLTGVMAFPADPIRTTFVLSGKSSEATSTFVIEYNIQQFDETVFTVNWEGEQKGVLGVMLPDGIEHRYDVSFGRVPQMIEQKWSPFNEIL